ncbi:MAG: hypothetical protein QMC89_05425 [Candidatus Hodarchaeaceae archaeon]|nr:hypothetical protein [Candidatus Hodarchaeaceae archaeon]
MDKFVAMHIRRAASLDGFLHELLAEILHISILTFERTAVYACRSTLDLDPELAQL